MSSLVVGGQSADELAKYHKEIKTYVHTPVARIQDDSITYLSIPTPRRTHRTKLLIKRIQLQEFNNVWNFGP